MDYSPFSDKWKNAFERNVWEKIRKIIRKICSILINKCMLCKEQMIEIQKEAYIIYLILSLLYQWQCIGCLLYTSKNMMAYGLVHLFSICRKNNCVKFWKICMQHWNRKDGFIPLLNTENLKVNETEDILPILRHIHLKISYMTCMALK